MAETILNLNNNKFEQESGEILSFSGCNKIFGQLNIENSGSINSDNNYKISGQTFISSGVNDFKTIKIGCNITSIDNNNIAIGADSIVTGDTSIGIGYYSCSINTNSIAIGCFSRAYGFSDISIGTQATTSGTCSSIAIGFFSLSNGDCSITIGHNSYTSGKTAISIGYRAEAVNSGSTVIGDCICNTISKSIGFGWYFDSTSYCIPPILFAQESCSYIDGNDPILAIGHKDGNARIDIIATGSTCGFRLKDNNEGQNKILTSDVNGYATWSDPITGSSSSQRIYKSISQSSHGFSINDFIGWSGGTYNKAIADGTYDGEFIGLVTDVPDSNTFEVTYAGYVTGLTGLVQNTTYFLSENTAGLITSTAPTGLTEIIKSVIVADSTTSGWVLSYPGVEISTGSTATITGATNGLSVNGLDVVLGGTLNSNTTISGLSSNTLEFNGGLLRYSSDYTSNIGPRDIPDAEWVTGQTSSGGINWDGTTSNAIGTYVSSTCICAEPNAFVGSCGICIEGDLELCEFARNQQIFLTRTDSGNDYCFSIYAASTNNCQLLSIRDCKDGATDTRMRIDCDGVTSLCNHIDVYGDVNVYEPGGPDGFKMCWNDTEQSIDFVIN